MFKNFKLKFVLGILPVIVHYADIKKKNVAGYASGPYVRIKPEYRHDEGLHEHEFMHVKQGYIGLIGCVLLGLLLNQFIDFDYILEAAFGIGAASHPLLYLLVTRYKLFAEVVAYAKQAEFYPTDKTELFGKFIAENYKLDISAEDATKMIRKSMS